MPDQMQLELGIIGRGLVLFLSLLDAIFSEQGQPRPASRFYILEGEGFGDRHQADILRASPGASGGRADPLPDRAKIICKCLVVEAHALKVYPLPAQPRNGRIGLPHRNRQRNRSRQTDQVLQEVPGKLEQSRSQTEHQNLGDQIASGHDDGAHHCGK